MSNIVTDSNVVSNRGGCQNKLSVDSLPSDRDYRDIDRMLKQITQTDRLPRSCYHEITECNDLPLRNTHFFWIFSVNYSFFNFGLMRLKGHSQLCDCADLDTSFSHFEKSLPQTEIKVHQEIRFIFLSVSLDFQSFTGKPVFECPFARSMILVLSYLVKNSIYRLSLCKLAMEWYVMRMCTSWLCRYPSVTVRQPCKL